MAELEEDEAGQERIEKVGEKGIEQEGAERDRMGEADEEEYEEEEEETRSRVGWKRFGRRSSKKRRRNRMGLGRWMTGWKRWRTKLK